MVDGCFVLAAAYAGCNPMVIGLLFAISVGAQGVQISTMLINMIDVSPNYAASVSGVCSMQAGLMGLIVPVIIGFLTPNVSARISEDTEYNNHTTGSHFLSFLIVSSQSLQSEWLVVFWITGFVHILKIVEYLILGSGESQPWNNPDTGNEKPNELLKDKDIEQNAINKAVG